MQHLNHPQASARTSFGVALCLLSLPALGCVEEEDGFLTDTEFGVDELDDEFAVSDKGEALTADWALLPSAHLSEETLAPLDAPDPASPEFPSEAAQDLSSEPAPVETTSVQYCTQKNDCFSTQLCQCWQGQCTLGLIGPQPPAGTCDQPPARACSSAIDCQGGCACIGGTCSPVPPGPLNPNCHLPPPDSFEYDNVDNQWSAYSGPQHHSFHYAADVDWVAVYIGTAGLVRFRTHGLINQADTKIKVFAFDNLVKGALVGQNDDIGGPWWVSDSKSSRVDVQVPPNSTYLIKIVNHSPSSVYTDSHQFPEYNFTISYL